VIVVDTSALMAVLLNEQQADDVLERLANDPEILISAATVAEALIVARRRGVGDAMAALISGLGATIVPVSLVDAEATANAYDRWGKGNGRAGLNFGDCFAYALAHANACPLLFVGADFSATDIAAALPP
jgi:ribonuclease VapC